MIKKVIWKNFQNHTKKVIEFAPDVTVIVGASDKGKSALFRGIRWVATGRPVGGRYVKKGKTNCSVKIITSDGTVKRSKNKKTNSYEVNGKVLKAFQAKVPQEVTYILGLSEINFQNQFDGPYWFSLSPKQITLKLNDIVNLSELDKIQSKCQKMLRKTKTEKDFLTDKIIEDKKELKSLEWVPECYAAHKELKNLKTDKLELEEKEERLSKLLKNLVLHEERVNLYSRLVYDFIEVNNLYLTIIHNEQKEKKIKSTLKNFKGTDLTPVDFSEVQKLREECDKLANKESRLVILRDSIIETEQELNTVSDKLKQFLRKQKRCPLCQSKLKPNQLQSVFQISTLQTTLPKQEIKTKTPF